MGPDYPFPWTKTAVDHILATPGLSDGERVAILEETAEKLLAIRARSGEGRLRVGCGLSTRNIRDLAASLKTPQFSASNRRCKYLTDCVKTRMQHKST
jgi:hypothetical protein